MIIIHLQKYNSYLQYLHFILTNTKVILVPEFTKFSTKIRAPNGTHQFVVIEAEELHISTYPMLLMSKARPRRRWLPTSASVQRAPAVAPPTSCLCSCNERGKKRENHPTVH